MTAPLSSHMECFITKWLSYIIDSDIIINETTTYNTVLERDKEKDISKNIYRNLQNSCLYYILVYVISGNNPQFILYTPDKVICFMLEMAV